MRICFQASSAAQGLCLDVSCVALALARSGHEVHVLTFGEREQSPGLAQELLAAGLQIHRFDCLSRGGWRGLLASGRHLRRFISELAPHVVHIYGASHAFQTRRVNDKALRVVVPAAMGIGSRSGWPARFGGFLLSRYADRVIAQCEAEYDRLGRTGIRCDMIRTVPAAVDCQRFLQKRGNPPATRDAFLRQYGLPSSSRLMGYFAAFRPNKRHGFLITVFNSLAERFPDWALVLGGDGVERARCQQFVAELGLSQRVILPGNLPHDALAPLLAAMDAVVHCSASETFGKSMVEPLLFGVPTVVTRVGIGYELERDSKALVVAPDSFEELQDAVQRILRGDTAIEKMAKEAVNYVVARFDVSTAAQQLVKIDEGG